MAIYPYGSLFQPSSFPDASVDIDATQDGNVDSFATLDLNIKDDVLITNLNQRINDSKGYWDELMGFNLSNVRNDNMRMYLGNQEDANGYYKHETPYVENQIQLVVESIVSYVTARTPQSEVTPSDDNDRARKFATDLENAHAAHSLKFNLRGIIEICVRNWLLKRAAYIKLEFDPSYGKNGEIIPKAIDPEHIVWDKNAAFGANPGFVTQFFKKTVEELIYMFPEKEKEILASNGIQRRGPRNMTNEVVVKQTWFTYFAGGEPKEACVMHFSDVMLDKYADPNWLENRDNFLDAPMKPFIGLNVMNDGNHAIDITTPIEQAIKLQRVLNNRGQQITTNADKANGTRVINGKATGMTKEALENAPGGPNETVLLNPREASVGQSLDSMISVLPAHDLPQFVVDDKVDARTQLGNIGGAPTDFTGADAEGDDPTLGQAMMKRNNSAGRQDTLIRGVDTMVFNYFNLLTQMMFVWYDEEHFFHYNGSDGNFDKITVQRNYFKLVATVSVKAGGTIAFDKNRRDAIVLKLLEGDKFPLIDAYRELGFENPQKLYDNWAKQHANPMELAREGNALYNDTQAYVEFDQFMDGKKPKMKYDMGKDFILTLRKLMLTDEFLNAKPKYQAAMIKRVQEYIKSLELRTSLDEISQEDDIEGMNPLSPIPPPQPPAIPGMPPVAAPAVPGGPPLPPNIPGQPPVPAPLPAQGQPSMGSVFGGTGLPNPGAPQVPAPAAVGQLSPV